MSRSQGETHGERFLTDEERAVVRSLAALTDPRVLRWFTRDTGLGEFAWLVFRPGWEDALADQVRVPSTVDVDSSRVPAEIVGEFVRVWVWSLDQVKRHGPRWGETQLRWLAKFRVPRIVEDEARWARAAFRDGAKVRRTVLGMRRWLALLDSEWL